MAKSIFTLTALFLSVFTPCVSVRAAELSWSTYESPGSIAVVYGVRKSQDVVLVVLCERATGLVQVNPYLGTRTVKRDAPATITLSSSGGEVRVPGRAVFKATDGAFLIEGRIPSDSALISVLEGVGVLVIDIPGLRESVPLDDRSAAGAKRFRQLCPPRRG